MSKTSAKVRRWGAVQGSREVHVHLPPGWLDVCRPPSWDRAKLRVKTASAMPRKTAPIVTSEGC